MLLNGVCVLFDLDGTLVDTAADLAAAMNFVLSLAGRPALAAGDVRHLVGQGARVMLDRGFAAAGSPPPSAQEMEAHIAAFLAHYCAHIADHSRPFPGAVEAATILRDRGARLAVCTNKREEPARRLLAALGLDPLFDAIVGMDTIGAAKPDPAPLAHCLKLTRCQRGVFIGDSDTDVRAAAAAGMPSLIWVGGYGPLIEEAQARFDDFALLPELVSAVLA